MLPFFDDSVVYDKPLSNETSMLLAISSTNASEGSSL